MYVFDILANKSKIVYSQNEDVTYYKNHRWSLIQSTFSVFT